MASSGNFAVFNPLSCQEGNGAQGTAADDLSNANTKFTITNDSSGMAVTIATPPSGGKWYCEFYLSGSVGNYAYVGYYPVAETPETKKQWAPSSNTTWVDTAIVSVHSMGRYFYTEGQYTDSGATSFTAGDIISIALDLDNGATYFAKNNTWMNSGNPESGSSKTGAAPVEGAYSKEYLLAVGSAGSTGHSWTINAGQDSTFGGAVSAGGNADGNGFGDFKYAPPSGYLALCSANIPISDDIDPAQTDDDHPVKQMNVLTYTGNGSTRSITGLGFKPDLIFLKARNYGSVQQVYDSTRGGTKQLYPSQSGAEATYSYLITSFDNDGWSMGNGDTDINYSSRTFVTWCFRANGGVTSSNTDGSITSTVQANTKAGFSIVTYTGNATNGATFGHGLSAKPSCVFIKNRDAAQKWGVWHQSADMTDYQLLFLDTNAAKTTEGTQRWDVSAISSSVFGLGSHPEINGSSADYVAYLWHDVEGFQKFGSYEGNGNNDGPFIYTGFRPRYWFFKEIDAADDWVVYDTARSTSNPTQKVLRYDSTAVEFDGTTRAVDVLSNGLKIRTSNGTINTSGNTYIYGAWGDVPFKYNNTF